MLCAAAMDVQLDRRIRQRPPPQRAQGSARYRPPNEPSPGPAPTQGGQPLNLQLLYAAIDALPRRPVEIPPGVTMPPIVWSQQWQPPANSEQREQREQMERLAAAFDDAFQPNLEAAKQIMEQLLEAPEYTVMAEIAEPGHEDPAAAHIRALMCQFTEAVGNPAAKRTALGRHLDTAELAAILAPILEERDDLDGAASMIRSELSRVAYYAHSAGDQPAPYTTPIASLDTGRTAHAATTDRQESINAAARLGVTHPMQADYFGTSVISLPLPEQSEVDAAADDIRAHEEGYDSAAQMLAAEAAEAAKWEEVRAKQNAAKAAAADARKAAAAGLDPNLRELFDNAKVAHGHQDKSNTAVAVSILGIRDRSKAHSALKSVMEAARGQVQGGALAPSANQAHVNFVQAYIDSAPVEAIEAKWLPKEVIAPPAMMWDAADWYPGRAPPTWQSDPAVRVVFDDGDKRDDVPPGRIRARDWCGRAVSEGGKTGWVASMSADEKTLQVFFGNAAAATTVPRSAVERL